MKREELEALARKEVDYVWAVFDKDDADKYPDRTKRFEAAFTIAERENIKLAYSNEVFELWLLLYLIDIDEKTPLSRKEIYKKLQESIREHYKYKDYLYDHLHYDPETALIIIEIGSLEDALRRAEILFEKQKHIKPINANPGTSVHLLVQELLDLITLCSFVPD